MQSLYKPLIVIGVSLGTLLAQEEVSQEKLMAMNRIILEQSERLDGLSSLIEGLNASIGAMEAEKKSYIGRIEKLEAEVANLRKRVAALESMKKTSVVSETSSVKSSSKKEVKKTKKTPAQIYTQAVRDYMKKRYDNAIEGFEASLEYRYKPAASHFYLGEISYYRKQYDDALFHYKKSAELYDKATYMPVLLLHTGISLQNRGDKDNAKRFLQSVIDGYPDTKAAKIAKQRLKKR